MKTLVFIGRGLLLFESVVGINHLPFDCVDRFLFSQPGHLTIEMWNNIKNFRPSVWYTLTNILKNSWDLSMASLPFSSQPPMWSLRNFCTSYYEVNNLTLITCITVLMHFELWELKYAYYIRMMFKYLRYQISLNGDVHFFSTEFF